MNTPQGPQPYRHNQPPQPHRHPPRPPQPPAQYRPAPPLPQQYRGQPPVPPQQHFQTPQYGQPPAPQQPGQQPNRYGQTGDGIVVNTQFFPLAWVLFFVKPKIAVDGQETQAPAWGRTHLPARPGQHHVHVHVPYFLPPKMGPADATVDVRPGQVAELEYKAPMWAFSPGSLGAGPQKYNGVGVTIAIAVIPIAVVFVVIFLSVLLAVL